MLTQHKVQAKIRKDLGKKYAILRFFFKSFSYETEEKNMLI